MKFILFLIAIYIFILFLFKDRNFYKLIMIFGKKGSGKTSIIAKYSQKYIKKGYKVYCNVELPGTYLYDPQDIGLNTFSPNSIVFCDEVGLIWHNRDYKNFKKCLIEWFKLQRHYKIRMYLFSQTFDTDKVLRDLTDEMYLITRLGKCSILRKINKYIGISKDKDGNGQLVDCYKFGSIFDIKFIYLPRYYGLFKSFEVPELHLINATYQDFNDISIIYSDNKKYLLYKLNLIKSNALKLFNKYYVKIVQKINK